MVKFHQLLTKEQVINCMLYLGMIRAMKAIRKDSIFEEEE